MLQFLDLFDRALDEDGRQADRGLVDQEDLGADIRARAKASILLPAGEAARQLPPPLAQHRKGLMGHVEIAPDLGARR